MSAVAGSSVGTKPSPSALQRYYQFHSKIYDLTRWSFLFGRSAILQRLPATESPTRILEVGCGTGKNLIALAKRFPKAQIVGIDLSGEMLAVARQKTQAYQGRIQLIQRSYNQPLEPHPSFDLVLCSYALTMFNPGWEVAIAAAHADLLPGGRMAVVDFHDSRFATFRRWMGVNHVRMEGHLAPRLAATYQTEIQQMVPAYTGLWRYLMWIGRKA